MFYWIIMFILAAGCILMLGVSFAGMKKNSAAAASRGRRGRGGYDEDEEDEYDEPPRRRQQAAAARAVQPRHTAAPRHLLPRCFHSTRARVKGNSASIWADIQAALLAFQGRKQRNTAARAAQVHQARRLRKLTSSRYPTAKAPAPIRPPNRSICRSMEPEVSSTTPKIR